MCFLSWKLHLQLHVCVFMFVSHETRKGIMKKEEEIQEVGNGRLQEVIGED